MIDQRAGAVDGGAFLVAGDDQADVPASSGISRSAATKAAMLPFMSTAPRP
jgi:hypothetical protein